MFSHPVPRNLRVIGAAAVALILAVTSPLIAAAQAANSPFPGLELVKSKSVDVLYRRPDVDVSDYGKILIGEPVVEFSKNWNPRNYGTFGLSAGQLKKIRVDLADLAKGTFAKVLGEGGYQVVTEAGDGVLEITPHIVNLYISAPDTMTAGRSKTYTMDAGSMTLALEVSDSVTGTLLAVAYDQKRDSSSGRMQWATSVSNRAAASRMLTGWAELLKRELDAARAK
ncbi:MAG TPA: DUF3313 family protein [Steroidobacteraceae bacterium]|jgi:hypothetical protein|nr:DUF3313 family protein [Steroidobacteraceae bacterium]